MRRSPSKVLFFGFMTLFLAMLILGSTLPTTTAQEPVFPDDFLNDGRLFVYAALNGQNVIDANSASVPLVLDLADPMLLTLQINVTSTQDLNMSGSIVFYYQGIAVFPITMIDSLTHSTWIWVYHTAAVPVVNAYIDFASLFNYGPLKLITGVIQAAMEFSYRVEGDATLHTLTSDSFYVSIPSTPTDIFTSVTGISTSIATVGVVYGVGNGFMSLFDGLKTAYKLRGIHKKASEIKSLPNLTVLGALPLLFSMLAGMTKVGKKKDAEDTAREDRSVSEYIIRQRLRETAPDAWQADKCPKCRRDWNKKLDMCKKCNLTHDDARVLYADLLASKVPVALKVMGKKKSASIRTLAKKTKSTDYNAGVIAAAMVDTEVTEIVKVGTPLRSFIMNIAGLAFLVITWQQLLGDSASTFLTTLTVVGAAMSLAVIIALYISRKTQIQKFQSTTDAQMKWMPSSETGEADTRAEIEVDKVKAEIPEEEPSSEKPDIEAGISKEDTADSNELSGNTTLDEE
jgi:hypothetical protein